MDKLQFEYNMTLIRLFLNDLYYVECHILRFNKKMQSKAYALAIRIFYQTFRKIAKLLF
jgi:hypothetical protein